MTKPGGGGKRENEAAPPPPPPPSCHSLTAGLTIMACHHFLIRPVSKKRCNKTAVRHSPLPHHPLTHTHTHRYPESCYSQAHADHTQKRQKKKHIKHVKKKCYVTEPGNKTEKWRLFLAARRDTPNKPVWKKRENRKETADG